MTRLSDVIRKIEQDSVERQKLSDQGSPLSSMAEDVAEGKIAEALREVVEELKRVDSL